MREPSVLKGLPRVTYHFVGIGGYGMSGLARILAEGGYRVRGSDVRESSRIGKLRALGIDVAIGHDPRWIESADVVVYSTDVPDDNPELAAARRAGLPVWHRSEVLARLLNVNRGIAVTGTHGKTTTSAMIGSLLLDAGLDPTIAVGGEVDRWAGTGRLGRSEWVVAEACESDGTFLRYHPEIAVITNVEPEHLDRYQGSFAALRDAFAAFVRGLPSRGLVVLCQDDPEASRLQQEAPGRVVTYGLSKDASVRGVELHRQASGWSFTALRDGESLGRFTLEVPGRHNVVNALGAIAVGLEVGLDPLGMAESLRAFRGAHRRFEIVADCQGILIVDDYAHHPTEIRATLEAARERASGRVIAVFQPQRYSRTRNLMDEFSRAFGVADEIILTHIYSPPGEQPIPGVSGEALAERVAKVSSGKVHYAADKDRVLELLSAEVRPGDLVITMGAGDIWEVAYRLAERLSRAHPPGA